MCTNGHSDVSCAVLVWGGSEYPPATHEYGSDMSASKDRRIHTPAAGSMKHFLSSSLSASFHEVVYCRSLRVSLALSLKYFQ